VQLTGLSALLARSCNLAAVPGSLQSLVHLDLAGSSAAWLVLPATLTRLRELLLAQTHYGSVSGLGGLVALEVLDASHTAAATLGGSLAALRPLTRLRHLVLQGVVGLDPSSFTVIAGLQQLTHLNLACIEPAAGSAAAYWSVLACSKPLAALQQLNIRTTGADYSLAMFGIWLGRLTALTQLNMSGHLGANGNELLYLPHQLEELDLSSMVGMQRLPLGLLQLSALRVLDISGNPGLCQLESWFSALCSLEDLSLQHTGVVTEQRVLAKMPWLRRVKV
jgi:hypothetical protein